MINHFEYYWPLYNDCLFELFWIRSLATFIIEQSFHELFSFLFWRVSELLFSTSLFCPLSSLYQISFKIYESISRLNWLLLSRGKLHSFFRENCRVLTKKLAFSFSDHVITHISRKCQSCVIYYFYCSGNTVSALEVKLIIERICCSFSKPF